MNRFTVYLSKSSMSCSYPSAHSRQLSRYFLQTNFRDNISSQSQPNAPKPNDDKQEAKRKLKLAGDNVFPVYYCITDRSQACSDNRNEHTSNFRIVVYETVFKGFVPSPFLFRKNKTPLPSPWAPSLGSTHWHQRALRHIAWRNPNEPFFVSAR